jgi:hypothetical protein
MIGTGFTLFVKRNRNSEGCRYIFLFLDKLAQTVFRKYLLTLLLILTVLPNGCRRSSGLPEMLDSYYLEYEIRYLEERAGDIPTRILPKTMEAYYTKYYVLTKIEGFFNQFSLIQVADLRRRRVSTLLNFFGNKVFYEGGYGELPAGVVEPDRLDCRFTGENRIIGGLNSERVEVDTGEAQFSIYCTRDFSVRRPNISTPYRSVDYPLTDFRIQLSMLKMQLTCTGLTRKYVESKIFSIPDEYREVDRESMERIINSLFTKE